MAKDPELSKEAVLHAMHDMRNIPKERSVTENVIRHAQRDMEALAPAPPEPNERGLIGKLADKISKSWNDLRIGDGHAMGMAKLGAHELTQALVALPDSNMRPIEEPGVFGNEHMPQRRDISQDKSRGQDKDHTPEI